ncbi:alpha-1,4-glucan:alpha-1,4-glucan 6-glycosyltransferase [Thermanaerovibrio velox DSM 12556]|uniref:1,4-alpha-glucan branching enzyme GlgB n=2 Tax=Thermanaerovibrio TaxID=81461 RepID=H0UP46_9BACT|nr:alpha-1,4-glucan:alpha-1,4-glucan 6-glycosyltransferase [Thermanaerovibrio velox DSM 12556]
MGYNIWQAYERIISAYLVVMILSGAVPGISLMSDYDVYLFREGRHFRLYRCLGCHLMEVDGQGGALFAVWAPNAEWVSVAGDFNGWDRGSHRLYPRWDGSGVFEGFVPFVKPGDRYKYVIRSRVTGETYEKADPFGFFFECPPRSASVVWDLSYRWGDDSWMSARPDRNSLDSPWTVYEVHPGSWQRVPEDGNRPLSYRELAERLGNYLLETGFTHLELLPVMEHPFYGSWGYQTIGYFAPSARYGTPQDFMAFVDHMHHLGIGVILDWVPSHFPKDGHGLGLFDGTCLFEHQDPRKGYHPDWKSGIFNYDRNEVRSFLISSAAFWCDVYHADGLRVDAVASMLYLDYSRKHGEWIPNQYGGRENLGAIEFLRAMNCELYRSFPGIQTIAEESTAWPMVSRPTFLGGLGFGMKWNMGWMHDVLSHMSRDPVHRKWHFDELTFGLWYNYSENFVLPLSHDEVVHGKGSLWGKMWGDEWNKAASLRLLYGWMYCHPGKKLLFMGGEFGQEREWNHESSLDWHLMGESELHRGIFQWVKDLNRFVRSRPAMYQLDFDPRGFQWVDCDDRDNGILACLRFSEDGPVVLGVGNFTPVPRRDYRLGVPCGGFWREVLNSDASLYGGSGEGNLGGVWASDLGSHGRPYSLTLTIPGNSFLFFEPQG